MPLPKFDPWSAISDTHWRAHRAHRAYPDRSLGTLGTIGTSMHPQIDTFEERAAVLEFDFGVPRSEARYRAASDMGFASESELHSQIISAWRLCLTEAQRRDDIDQRLCGLALAFCNGTWINRCVALGWDELSLFAVSLEHPEWGGLVQFVGNRLLSAVTEEAAYVADTPDGRPQRFERFGNNLDHAKLIWQG